MRLKTKFDRENVIYFLNRNEIQFAAVEEIIVRVTGVDVETQLQVKRTASIKITYVVTDSTMPEVMLEQLKLDGSPQIEVAQEDAFASVELLVDGLTKKFLRDSSLKQENTNEVIADQEPEKSEVTF